MSTALVVALALATAHATPGVGTSSTARPLEGAPVDVVGTSSVAVVGGTSSTAAAIDALSSPIRAEEGPSRAQLLLLPLRLPEVLTELAFVPLVPLLLAMEKLHVHERFFDLVTNDERTMALVPIFDPINRSGISGGLAFLRNSPLGSPDRMIVLGLVRANRDYTTSLSYTRRLRVLSGKRIHFGAGYALDHDQRYYGLGLGSRVEDERLIRSESADLDLWIELPAPAIWNARVHASLRRRGLYPGTGDAPGLVAGADVRPPFAFERTLDYPEVALTLEYDTRDSESRTTRGVVLSLSGVATHDLNDAETGGLQATLVAGVYLPLAPLHRTLVLMTGASLASPIGADNEIPFHLLPSLGGSKTLRGYESGRYVDRVGLWGAAEYRYKIYEWSGSGTGLSATIFGDFGRVAPEMAELVRLPLRWSVGFGLRAEMNLFFLGRFQVAYSPEGFQFVLAVNDIL
ncbi:outer membrane protein assembly factor [Myxococcota bacterium]|nr:outer membrane protein assembly factor [Myxococcota bacterium]